MIRSVIIDDEEDARKSLQLTLDRYCPSIEVVAQCTTPEEGMLAIEQHCPDLIFLDIQMPGMTGFDLLKQLDDINFAVIFVTSYDQYAIKAIKFSALDYLLKPVDVDDLLAAIDRLRSEKNNRYRKDQYSTIFKNTRNPTRPFERLAVPTMDGLLFLQTADIIYCQAEGNYSTIYQVGKQKTLVSRTLKDFEMLLGDNGFCRVHHSHLINLGHVNKYVKGEGGYVELTDGYHVDISRRKKEAFLKMLQRI